MQLTKREIEIQEYLSNEDTKKALMAYTGNDPQKLRAVQIGILQAVQTYSLEKCTNGSIVRAYLEAKQTGLSLIGSTNRLYIIPYRNNRTGQTNAQIQLGAYGLVEIALRDEMVEACNAFDVRKGEFLGLDETTREPRYKFVEDTQARNKLEIIGFGSIYKRGRFIKGKYMSNKELGEHASKYSSALKKWKQNNPNKLPNVNGKGMGWGEGWYHMACKTTLKLMLNKFATLGSDLEVALKLDQIVASASGLSYADNPDFLEAMLNRDEVKGLINFGLEIGLDKKQCGSVFKKYGGVLDMPRENYEDVKNELIELSDPKFKEGVE